MKKEELRIVFFGTPEFAVESLARLVDDGFNIVAAVTMPDKLAGRGHKVFQSPVKEYAVAHGIPVLQPEKLKAPDFIEDLRALSADLFIVIAFRMLPEIVWAMPPLGTFNLHAALLPRYRGAAPINWAVINGDTETGVTTFFIDNQIDTGDILQRERISIGPDENVGSVHDRLMRLGAELTVDTVRHIIAGDLRPIPQDELAAEEAPSAAPKIFRETCRMDFSKSALQLHNFVRGLSPYPCAWAELYDGDSHITTVKILRAGVVDDKTLSPGTVSFAGGRMLVGAGGATALEIFELQPAGKRSMATVDYINGLSRAMPAKPRME